jgi:hypothetical protein
LATVEDFLVRGVSGLVMGYIGEAAADCWSCGDYTFCHCAERQAFEDRWSITSDEKCNF